jgi:hypothetical protein
MLLMKGEITWKREGGVAEGWRKLVDKELHDFLSSPSIGAIKSRTVKWRRHVACMREMRNAFKSSVDNP